MKSYLLAIAIFAHPVLAQNEVALSSAFAGGEGVNGEVLAIALQPDGKIIIGGSIQHGKWNCAKQHRAFER